MVLMRHVYTPVFAHMQGGLRKGVDIIVKRRILATGLTARKGNGEFDFPGDPWTPERDDDKPALEARVFLERMKEGK